MACQRPQTMLSFEGQSVSITSPQSDAIWLKDDRTTSCGIPTAIRFSSRSQARAAAADPIAETMMLTQPPAQPAAQPAAQPQPAPAGPTVTAGGIRGDIVPDGDPYEPPLSAAIPGYEKEGATTGEARAVLETLSRASRYFQRQRAGEQEGILPRLIMVAFPIKTPRKSRNLIPTRPTRDAPEGVKPFDQPVTTGWRAYRPAKVRPDHPRQHHQPMVDASSWPVRLGPKRRFRCSTRSMMRP